VELHESILRNVHLIIGWPASPLYADSRGALTEFLREAAGPENDWVWDGPMTFVTDEERGIDFALGPSELLIATEASSIELEDLPQQLAATVLEHLAVRTVRLVGAGSVWLAPASSAEELTEWLSGQLGTLGRPGTYDAFGGKPSSLGLDAEIEGDNFSYEVELKPMTGADAAGADEFKSDEEDDFPPVALYLDVTRSSAGDIPVEAAPQAFADNLNKAIGAAKKFDSAIREGL
jgi:hypothetical protein